MTIMDEPELFFQADISRKVSEVKQFDLDLEDNAKETVPEAEEFEPEDEAIKIHIDTKKSLKN